MLKILIPLWLSILTFYAGASDKSKFNQLVNLKIESKHMQVPLDISVTLPVNYEKNKSKKYPILFDLNPSSRLYHSGLNDWLSHNGENPWLETIIVTPANQHHELTALFKQSAKIAEVEQLLDIIEKEVLKTVDKNFRTNSFRIFNGFMRSGTVGLYTLLNRPSLFNAYVIATPVLTDNYLEVPSKTKLKLPTLTDRVRVLHLSTGNHSIELRHAKATEQLIEDLNQFAPKELEWHSKPTEGHFMSRPVLNLVHAVEVIFKDFHQHLSADSEISSRGAGAIIEHYQLLSEKKYGFEVPAERSLVNLANALIDSSTSEALAIYKKVTELYPNSAYAFYYFAAASVHIEDFDSALEYQKKAVEKSKGMPEWQQIRMKQTLANYEEKYGK